MTVPTVPTVINGKWIINLPEHRAVRPEWPDWEWPRLHSMSLNVGPGDYVWDIGSEEGDLSGLYQSWIGNGDGGMVLIEANCLAWPNIRLVWEENNFKPPVFCWEGFAGNEDRGWKNPLAEKGYPWPPCTDGEVISDHSFVQLNERPDIPALKLDSLREWIGAPSIITFDVEGSEHEVLLGARNILIDHKPLVFASLHPTFMLEQYNTPVEMLHQYMCDLGYREKLLGVQHEEFWAFWHPSGRELRL